MGGTLQRQACQVTLGRGTGQSEASKSSSPQWGRARGPKIAASFLQREHRSLFSRNINSQKKDYVLGVNVGQQPPLLHTDSGHPVGREGPTWPQGTLLRCPQTSQTPTTETGPCGPAGAELGAERVVGSSAVASAHPALAHIPPRAWFSITSRRVSTAGKCRPLAGCRTSTGPSDTWGQREGRCQ